MALFNTHFATSLLVFLITLSVVTAHITPTPAPVSASYISSSPKGSARAPASYISSSPKGSASAPAPSRSSSSVLPNGPSPFDAMENGLASIPLEELAKDSQFVEAYMAKAANQIEQFINVVEKKLKDPKIEQTRKECLDTCAEVYGKAVDALRIGMEDIHRRDFRKAKSDVGLFKINLDTCDDCLGDVTDDPEFNKIDNWARGVGNDCLDKITKYTPNPSHV